MDWPEEPRIRRDVGPDQCLQCVVDGGQQSGFDEIDTGANLGRGIEIEEDLVTAYF